ncbi:MAG: DNA primase [bacterium]|nr:DNA primase [bacterium]
MILEIMISSPIEEIKARLDITEVIKGYIKLQKAGANYRAVCPFHNEKKPSFFISPARQIWHCFGACSEGGDIFKFVMKIEGVEFGDALRILAQKAGVELKGQNPESASWRTERERLYEISNLACKFFEKQLEASSAGQEAKKYLLERGVKEESIKKWRLGYAPDIWQGVSNFLIGRGYKSEEVEKAGLSLKSGRTGNYYDRFRGRIIFPIFDLSSQAIGFGGRIFKQTQRQDGQEEAKYINTPATSLYDKSRILYGLNKAGITIRKKDVCILVEGYMDAIMINQAGFENVAATSGTALTPYQLRILKRYSDNLLTAFDMDIAGDSATKRGIDLAQAEGFNIKIITISQGKDPAEAIANNPDQWQDLVDKAKSIHDFYFQDSLAKHDKNNLEGKKQISKDILPIIKKIPNKIEQDIWIKDLANVLEVNEQNILEELKKTSFHQNENIRRDDFEKEKPVVLKTRKELLEERLAILIIKSPEVVNLIETEDLNLFSLEGMKIIEHLKTSQGFIKEVPEELKDKINFLSLKSEIDQEEIDPRKEFDCCFKELKILTLKDKLDIISKEIKKAEQDKNFEKVQDLMQQFNQGARLLQ